MKNAFWALALAVALLPAGSLRAANITITWTGNVVNGIDDSNTFGLGSGADLTDESFTAKFVVDPTAGFIQTAADFFDTRGGTDVPVYASPVLSAELTINSQTFSFQSDKFGGYTRDARPGRSHIYTEAHHQSGPAVDALYVNVFLFDNSIPFTGIDENLAIALTAGQWGVFQAFQPDGTRLFVGNLIGTYVTINSSGPGNGAVPEPSTAVLLGSAVAALGILRRCRWARHKNSDQQ